jgi:hypothetical protein
MIEDWVFEVIIIITGFCIGWIIAQIYYIRRELDIIGFDVRTILLKVYDNGSVLDRVIAVKEEAEEG